MLLGPRAGLLPPGSARSDVTEEMVGGAVRGTIDLDARQEKALSHDISPIRDIAIGFLPSPTVGSVIA